MPFGVVSGVSPGVGALDWAGDRRRGRGSFWENSGRPIATNGDFVDWLCESVILFPNYFGEDLFSKLHCDNVSVLLM